MISPLRHLVNVRDNIVSRVMIVLVGLLVVAILVGLTALWSSHQAIALEKTNLLSTSTRSVNVHSEAEQAYTYFLKLDRQANMWVGLNPTRDRPLFKETLAQVYTEKRALNASVSKLRNLSTSLRVQKVLSHLTTDVPAYEKYLTEAMQLNARHHQRAQFLIFYQNNAATNRLESDFGELVRITHEELLHNITSSINHLDDGSHYLLVGDLVLVILILLMMVLTWTQLRPMENDLRRSERKHRLLFGNITDLVTMVSKDRNIILASPSHQTLLHRSPQELHGQPIEQLMHPEDIPHLLPYFGDSRPVFISERLKLRLITQTGDWVYVESNAQLVQFDDEEDYIMLVSRDVTGEENAKILMEHMAYHDPLTDLPNRRLFDERLSRTVHTSPDQPLTIVFLDLNGFKLINDTLGHVFGDEVLQYVARRLQRYIPEGSFLSRFGGDEFVMLLQGCPSQDSVTPILEHLFMQFTMPVDIQGRQLHISLSAGISQFPSDSKDPQTLMRQADLAMYHAKSSARHTWCFYHPNFDSESARRFTIEEALKFALERNELSVVYQPQVELVSQHVIGVEALLRWHHPELGWISPAEFIPIAEDTGAILTIGDWVLHTACLQNKQWQREGKPSIIMSVNVSVHQMMQADFVDNVSGALRQAELEPQWLELEITESVMVDKPKRVQALLGELKALGIRLAVDDFGTGYSSLKYLREFPLDVLKIDKSFVQDIEFIPANASIVSTMVSLAHSLDLSALTEGVESEGQVKVLISANCDEAQGYLFGKPMPPNMIWRS